MVSATSPVIARNDSGCMKMPKAFVNSSPVKCFTTMDVAETPKETTPRPGQLLRVLGPRRGQLLLLVVVREAHKKTLRKPGKVQRRSGVLWSPTILVAGGLSAEQVIDPRRWRDLQENPDENQVPGPKRAPLTPRSRKNSRL